MTRALYHENGLQFAFQSPVVAVQGTEVALEATAFYPEGGGQGGDVGVWAWAGGEAQVVATRKDRATGTVWHRLAGDLPAPGTVVAGQVEAATRWRHMQRHSGEHLLAQAFRRVSPAFQVAAVGMSSPDCHLDLLGDPAEKDVRAAETLLREVLGRTELTLETPIVAEAELAQYPLRRETKVRGQVRLVIFRDAAGETFDVSACGGTHVPRAGQCAPVVILRTERIKGGLTRVTFRAGEEASAYLSGVYQQARALGQSLSVPVEGLPERVADLLSERESQEQVLASLRAELARQEVAATPAELLGGVPVRFVVLADSDLLQPVLTATGSGEVVVALAHEGRCGIGSGSPAVRAGELLRSALTATGGKGGGKPDLAQGRTEQPQHFMGVVRELLTRTVLPEES